ncbi:CTP synthetase [Silicimonas sp. MF1-12-2]|uniref:CTP synthetase n=1 Tax=Silicimonas sp. MF1-12-2 TaxID=3384793 RepID=UPI0039B4D2B6
MSLLFLLVHLFVGSAVAGVAIVAALVMGFDTLWPLLIAAMLGVVLSFPASWLVARRLARSV